MKKSELAFSAALVPLDYATLIAAGLAAYYVRFTTFSDLRPVQEVLSIRTYLDALVVVAAVWIAIFAISGLYSIRSTRRAADEIAKIFLACSTGILIIILLIFFQREFFSSRFVVLAGWVFAIVLMIIERAIVRGVQHAFFRRGIGVHNLVIVGSDESSKDLVSYLSQHPALGYRVVDRFDGVSDQIFERIIDRMKTMRVDEIVQTDATIVREDALRLLDFSNDRHIIFKYSADLFETRSAKIEVQALGGIPFVEIIRTPLDGWGKIIKRAFDIVGSVVLLVLASPLFLIIAILIKLDSNGPAILGLERVGEAGRTFNVLKFRSMIKNAEALKQQLLDQNEREGPLFKMKNDPRVTRIGRLLRRTSLDELPQLWNVVKGQMSLVGPRPHEPAEVARYQKHHRKLLSIKPGLSGMAQTSGRSDLSFEDEVRLDTYYIENWSLKLDVQILLKTPWVVFSARSAV